MPHGLGWPHTHAPHMSTTVWPGLASNLCTTHEHRTLTCILAEGLQAATWSSWVQLHLVDHGPHACSRQQLCQVAHLVVAHANGPELALPAATPAQQAAGSRSSASAGTAQVRGQHQHPDLPACALFALKHKQPLAYTTWWGHVTASAMPLCHTASLHCTSPCCLPWWQHTCSTPPSHATSPIAIQRFCLMWVMSWPHLASE